MILWIVTIICVIVADQLSKLAVLSHLAPGSVTVIPGVLDFTYVENRGAAFGLLADHRWVFLILSTVAIAAVVYYLIRYKPASPLIRLSLALVAGGGAANMIDRVGRGFVVDFIDVTFVRFYVFNVADSCVCVGCALLVLWMILDSFCENKKKAVADASSEGAEDAHSSRDSLDTDGSGEDVTDRDEGSVGEAGDE